MRLPINTLCLPVVLLAGCGAEDLYTECTSSRHCHLSDGVPECDPGYTWFDPNDEDSYLCVPITTCDPSAQYCPNDSNPSDYDPSDYDPSDYDPSDYDPSDYDPSDWP